MLMDKISYVIVERIVTLPRISEVKVDKVGEDNGL